MSLMGVFWGEVLGSGASEVKAGSHGSDIPSNRNHAHRDCSWQEEEMYCLDYSPLQ